jgi:PAS domain-containing protein
VDERGDLVFLNEAAEGLLGIRFDDVDQLPFETWTTMFRPRTLAGEALPGESLPLAEAVLHRRPAHGKVRLTSGDGVERTIEATAFPLEGGRGRLIGGVAMFWEPNDG